MDGWMEGGWVGGGSEVVFMADRDRNASVQVEQRQVETR